MWYQFLPLGFFVGALGTMIGAGGGFILVPALLLIFPDLSPETVTAVSLAVVFANATSGTIAYSLKKCVDYKSGLIFTVVALPGVFLGTGLTRAVTRNNFDPIFGAMMAVLGLYLVYRKTQSTHEFRRFNLNTNRAITDAHGETISYRFNLQLGLWISAAVGFISSFLGIGGGIIHVPALALLLNYPVKIATATSHFILMLMAGAATLNHFMHGALAPGYLLILWLAPGVVVGAQLGAWLSHKVKGSVIIKLLGFALVAASFRFLWPLLHG